MANRIEVKDFISPDIKKEIKSVGDQLGKLIKQVESVTKSSVDMKNEFNKGAESQKKVSDNVKMVNDSYAKLSKSEINIQKIEKQSLDIQSKIIAERSHEAKILETLRQKRAEQKKAIKEEIKLKRAEQSSVKVLTGSYAEIQKALSANIVKYKNLTQAERNNAKVGGVLEKKIKAQTQSLSNLDARMGKFNRNVGNYASGMKNLMASFGVFLGARTFIKILGDITTKIKDFDAAQSSLAAVLGKSKKDIKDLTKEAIRYGSQTEFTSKQVSDLQKELAKLGFTQVEIRQSTRSILEFASATGSDLAEAAKVAGSALRGFGMDASEMDRVVSVLAVATTKSALSFEDYQAALSNVAPVAKAFGFTIEDTIALYGKLRDSGFDASKATTAVRNILLNLADTNGKLARKLGGSVTNFDDMIDSLKKLKVSGVDLNTTLQLTDKRSVAAFNTFLDGAENARELRDSLVNVNEEMSQMVETKLDNLSGDIIKLASAWDAFILSLEDGQGSLALSLRNLTQFTKNVVTLMTVASKGTRQFMIDEAFEENQKQAQLRLTALQESLELLDSEEMKLGVLINTQKAYSNTLNKYKQSVGELEYMINNEQQAVDDLVEKRTDENTGLLESIKIRQQAKKEIRERIEQAEGEVIVMETQTIPTLQIYIELLQNEIDKTNELIKSKEEQEQIEGEIMRQRMSAGLDKLSPIQATSVTAGPELFEEKILKEKRKLLAEGVEYEEEYTNNILNLYINHYQDLLDQTNLSIKERVDLQIAMADKQIELQNIIFNKEVENAERLKEIEIEKAIVKREIGQETFNILSAFNDRQMEDYEAQKDFELQLAGDNAGERERIEKKYDAERRKIQRRQAIIDKGQAIFNTILNTKEAIAKALTKDPTGILATFVGILGGLQLATIIATPIPKFKKGTDFSPEGMAIVGEAGSELVEYPSGQKAITPDTATMTYLPKGSKVHTAEETKAIQASMNDKKLDELISVTKNKSISVNQTMITDDGMKRIVKDSNNYTEWIDTYFRK